MKRFLHIWSGISLGLLAIFLGVWVLDSYKEEKSRLEGEVNLELAHSLLETIDIDFTQLITSLKMGDKFKKSKSFSFSIDSASSISRTQISTKIQIDTSQILEPVIKKRIFKDSNGLAWIPPLLHDSTWAEGTQMVIATARESELSQGSELREIYPEKYQAKFDAAMSKLPMDALKAIIPQILMALGLFGTVVFAVVMLQRYYRQKEVEMEAKNQFINNMTHELKTPVATIGIALEAIQDFAAKPQKAEEYMRTSRKELERLDRLIDQVMSASQSQYDLSSYKKEPISFPELLQAVLHSLGPQIEERGAHINLLIPDGGAQLLGDPEHMGNMLRNLLDNSLKYSHKEVEIEVEVEIIGDKFHLYIRDNGIGIPARFQKKVFDQFFRVPTGDIHTIKGYGLGLNYVEQVVKKHNGKVQLHSQEGKGTEVHIRFPLHHG